MVHTTHETGNRFNRKKLVLDPYAKAIDRTLIWDDKLFGYQVSSAESDLSRDDSDSGYLMPKSVIVDSNFPWGGDRRPDIPWHETIIYELHVKGFTARHPGVPANLRVSCEPFSAIKFPDHQGENRGIIDFKAAFEA
jgi:isoamylase